MPEDRQQLYLGVDGGASSIGLAVVDQEGQVIYQQSVSTGANYHILGLNQTVEHLESAVGDLLEQLEQRPRTLMKRTVFGLAGCNFDSDKHMLTQALRRSSISSMLGGDFEVFNDSRIALRAGTSDGVGIVLIAGTGSNCYGWQSDGREGKAGGIDHILSDEGSGYDIGLRALRAVVAQLDGRGEQTLLTSAIFRTLKVSSLESLYDTVYERYGAKHQIAGLAAIVFECAAKDDVIAKDILNHSVNELTRLVDAVVKQLEWQEQAAPIVLVGGIATHQYIFSRLSKELKRVAPQLKPIRLEQSAALGAAHMAREHS